MSINTWDAVDNVERLRAYLVTGPADVVVLSELGPEKQHLPAALKAVYPYQSSCAQRYDCSIALISRIPFEAAGTVPYSKEMPAFVWARFAGALHVIGRDLYDRNRGRFGGEPTVGEDRTPASDVISGDPVKEIDKEED